MIHRNKLFVLAFLLVVGFVAKSAVYFDTTVTAKDGAHKLSLCIPKSYDTTQHKPLIVALHKYGGNASDYCKDFELLVDSLGIIVACPDNSGQGYTEAQFDVITATITLMQKKYNIDSKSVYLNGMSMNGTYTLDYGLKNLYPIIVRNTKTPQPVVPLYWGYNEKDRL